MYRIFVISTDPDGFAYKAFDPETPGRFAHGETKYEAVARLLMDHSDKYGIDVVDLDTVKPYDKNA